MSRCLVIGDVHANAAALAAVAGDSLALGGVDELWCLGDAFGYGPQPGAAVRALLDWRGSATVPGSVASVFVAGDHEALLMGDLPATDFHPQALLAMYWTAWLLGMTERAVEVARYAQGAATTPRGGPLELGFIPAGEAGHDTAAVAGAYLARLTGVKAPVCLERDGGAFVLVHGGLGGPVTAYTSDLYRMQEGGAVAIQPNCASELERRLGAAVEPNRSPVLLCSHTHVPMAIVRGPSPGDAPGYQALVPGEDTTLELGAGPAMVNPGSVGCSRDGDPRASYALLDTARRTVRFRRAEWDGRVLRRSLGRLPGGEAILRRHWPHLAGGREGR